jgi:thiamine pyrophosphokinase
MKNKAAIYLNGAYPPDHSYFYIHEYKRSVKDSVVIVTDGGLKFFIVHKLTPDLIIGDWDSANIKHLKEYPKAVTISVPSDGKAYTDSELALDWCVKNKIREVTIYGGIDSAFETDQLLGNIFLLFAFKKKFYSIKMRDYCQEIIPIYNESYNGNGKPGDMLSVVPISEKIVYAGDGLRYDPKGKTYKFGKTTPLRNLLDDTIFRVEIKGRAVLIRHF